jgi:endo-1,4-beta-D-glucanase Y
MTRFVYFFLIVLVFWTVLTSRAQINTPSGATVPFGSNTGYAFGMMPTNLPTTGAYGRASDIAATYNSWKSTYVENCGTNQARVRFDNTSETVSEGIAYGMLLAAYAADRDLFNRLWAYYKQHRNGNGVMHWKISGCSNVIGFNGATDAELDAAMALIVADKQWPNTTSPHNYKTDAVALINAIRLYEINATDYTFENGDAWKPNCRNPSYQAPGYARVFKLFMAENGQANNTFWDNVVQRTENLFINNAHPSSGLSTNWCTPAGPPSSACSGSGTAPDKFGYDACRAPWRQGIDYLWYGPSTIQTIINRQADYWIGRGGAGQVRGGDGLNHDGTGWGDHNAAFVGPVGAMSLAASTTSAHQTFCNNLYTTNRNDALAGGYFTKILQMIGLFVQTGNFWNPYAQSSSSLTVSITSPTEALFVEGDAITFTATASTSNGTISRVDFYNGTQLIGTDNTSPYSLTWTPSSPGSYSITATVTSSTGATSSSSARVVTIARAVPQVTSITIDGTIETVWEGSTTTALTRVIQGAGVPNNSDLSASYKTFWNSTYFYILVQVTDNARINNGGTDVYNDDVVEVFFDIGNDKATTYGSNDVQYSFRWNDPTVYATAGRSTSGINFILNATANGYVLEARFPWTTLSHTPAIGNWIGFEVEVNDDDDGGDRDHKLSWNASQDEAWQNPSFMGTARLTGQIPVTPFSTTLSGPSFGSPGQTDVVYSVPNQNGYSYQWSVPSGVTITSGQGTSQLTVSFGSQVAGNISIQETNQAGQVATLQKWVVVSTTTAIDVEINNRIELYPNPLVGNELVVQWTGGELTGGTYEVIDPTGKVVVSGLAMEKILRLEIILPDGLYLFQWKKENVSFTQRLIVQ